MSKKRKWKKKSFKRLLSEKEALLAKLHKLAKANSTDDKDRKVAYSLINWHLRMNGLSPSQWDYADAIIKRYENVKLTHQVEQKQYLYGISDGEMIKLGMSNNIKKRLEALQTSNPKTLRIVWELYTGRCTKLVRRLERKLHRRCKKYRVRGEWFSINCFDLVKTFRGQDQKKEEPLSDNDIELIKESQKH